MVVTIGYFEKAVWDKLNDACFCYHFSVTTFLVEERNVQKPLLCGPEKAPCHDDLVLLNSSVGYKMVFHDLQTALTLMQLYGIIINTCQDIVINAL